MYTFIGIDLAWSQKNNTSTAAIQKLNEYAELSSCACLQSNEEIVEWILSKANENVLVAVDAPLIVKNNTGAREVDKLITREFGKYEAGALPASLKNASRGTEILAQLIREGFSYDPYNIRKSSRTVIEVYPHTAQVVLFGLKKTLKYKRGAVADRKRELSRLRRLVFEKFTSIEPKLHKNNLLADISGKDISKMKGSVRKHFEDTLDAIVCAYTAYYYWSWEEKKCRVFGNTEYGYIVTPYW